MANKHTKRVLNIFRPQVLQLEQLGLTTHLLESLKPKPPPAASQTWATRPSCAAGGVQMGQPFGREFGGLFFYKIKYTLTLQSISYAPWNLPKGVENLCPHKNLHIVA